MAAPSEWPVTMTFVALKLAMPAFTESSMSCEVRSKLPASELVMSWLYDRARAFQLTHPGILSAVGPQRHWHQGRHYQMGH